MNGRVHTVRSADGTAIAYEEVGAGPPLVLVHGSVSDRTYWAPVVPALAERFTVMSIDRRGRGDSGDAPSYAVEREAEDIAAVVDAVGEPVHLVGHSYGGLCALESAPRTANLAALTLYEPATIAGGTIPEDLVTHLDALIAAGERDAAVELMMGELVGLPADVLVELRADRAAWQPMADSVHTLPRELRTVAAFVFTATRYSGIDVPVVLLEGRESPPELRVGVGLVHAAVAGARVVTMAGVDHEAVTTGPDVLVTALTRVAA